MKKGSANDLWWLTSNEQYFKKYKVKRPENTNYTEKKSEQSAQRTHIFTYHNSALTGSSINWLEVFLIVLSIICFAVSAPIGISMILAFLFVLVYVFTFAACIVVLVINLILQTLFGVSFL